MVPTSRILRSTLAGAAAWWIGLNYIFGAAQPILASPALQSPKMNAIYEMLPPPRIATDPWLLPAAFLVCAFLQACVFAFIRGSLPNGPILRGAAFGAVAWALFVPWFEFYLPWSLMLEPTLLVVLELFCWAGVMLLVGVAISLAFGKVPPEAGLEGRGKLQ
ncbi:MAG TPA: hypothetical protein VGA98_08465 [Allosphingosinicella sp.]|jgi:hypothetical protein